MGGTERANHDRLERLCWKAASVAFLAMENKHISADSGEEVVDARQAKEEEEEDIPV